MQPCSYVIAHTSSRVAGDCVRSLEQHGWPYEIVPAVDGSNVTMADWQNIGVTMNTEGKMSRRLGAQGCWLSHFGLWQRCLQSQLPIVVLEHDALITDRWPEQIDLDSHIIKLYSQAECKVNPAFGRWSKGAHAYTLTPDQASILINHARLRGAQAVDKHLGDLVVKWRFWHTDIVALNPRRGPSSTSRITSK